MLKLSYQHINRDLFIKGYFDLFPEADCFKYEKDLKD